MGEQVLLNGRQEDCVLLLNFLRAATVERVRVRGGVRRIANTPPDLTQIMVPVPPQDGPILEHAHR